MSLSPLLQMWDEALKRAERVVVEEQAEPVLTCISSVDE
jgi:hypothetical protein